MKHGDMHDAGTVLLARGLVSLRDLQIQSLIMILELIVKPSLRKLHPSLEIWCVPFCRTRGIVSTTSKHQSVPNSRLSALVVF